MKTAVINYGMMLSSDKIEQRKKYLGNFDHFFIINNYLTYPTLEPIFYLMSEEDISRVETALRLDCTKKILYLDYYESILIALSEYLMPSSFLLDYKDVKFSSIKGLNVYSLQHSLNEFISYKLFHNLLEQYDSYFFLSNSYVLDFHFKENETNFLDSMKEDNWYMSDAKSENSAKGIWKIDRSKYNLMMSNMDDMLIHFYQNIIDDKHRDSEKFKYYYFTENNLNAKDLSEVRKKRPVVNDLHEPDPEKSIRQGCTEWLDQML